MVEVAEQFDCKHNFAIEEEICRSCEGAAIQFTMTKKKTNKKLMEHKDKRSDALSVLLWQPSTATDVKFQTEEPIHTVRTFRF